MTKINYYQLQYKPTGIIFKIPQQEAVDIMKSDRDNYKILDKNFVDDVAEPQQTTVSQQVVVTDEEVVKVEELELMKNAQLKAFCNQRKISFDKNDTKAVLIEKILAALGQEEKIEEIDNDEVCKPCYADGKTPSEEDCKNCEKKAEIAQQVIEG